MEMNLTHLEYMVAHAPDIVPGWFEPTMPPKPEPLSGFTWLQKILPKSEAVGLDCMLDEYSMPIPANVPIAYRAAAREFREKQVVRSKQIREWDDEREKQKYLQWPMYWAIEQLNRINAHADATSSSTT